MALKHSSALLLAAFLSLTAAFTHAAGRPDDLAPGNWPTFNNEVNAVLPLPDGSFIVGGEFQSVTIPVGTVAQSRSKLVRILSNGTIDLAFPTADSRVRALAVDSAGRIFIGGDFDNLYIGNTPVPRKKVARLTSTFAIDTVFDTSTSGPTGSVLALAPTGDGSVYIGGQFNTVGGVTSAAVKRMAKLKTNGTLDTSFTSGASNDVHTILRLGNGTMYVGGISNTWPTPVGIPLPGKPLARLVKISASGSRDNAFVAFPATDFVSIVYSVIQLADGSLLVGANNGVKRFNAATGATIPYSLTGHFLAFGAVGAVAQQVNGKLLSGAYGTCFLTDSDGVKDPAFDITSKFSQHIINTIKLDKNGRIFIGGNFTYSDGVNTRNKFVVLNGTDPKAQSLTITPPVNPTFTPGQNVFTLAATSSAGLPVTLAVTSGPATFAGNKLTITGAGTIVLTGTQAGNTLFDPAVASIDIIVPKQSQSLTFAPLIDRPNTSAPFFLSAATSSGLPVSYTLLGGPATLSGNRLSLNGATGTVTIRASQPGNADFDPTADIEQSFEVFEGTPALLPQTIVFGPQSPRSANEDPFPVFAAATSGLPVDFTISGPANIAGNLVTLTGVAGSVVITASQPGNANFLPAIPVKQTIKVGPAATSLTLTNLIQTYTGNARIVDVVGGTADSIFYTVNKVKGTTPPTAAGSYPVEAVSGTLKKTGTLVVNKAPLLVVADDKRKFIGQINPPLTFAYSGFLGSDHAGNAFTKAPTITTKATTTSPGGDYPITPAGGAAANYALVYVNGNLKVESWAGQYEAILTDGNTNLPSAKIEFTVSAGSRDLTGKLTTAKQSVEVPFKGSLGLDFGSEYAMADISAIVGKGDLAVVYNIRIDIPLNAEFSVTVTRQEGGQPAVTLGAIASGKKLQLYSGKPPVTYAGAYTLIFAPDTTVSALPKPTGSGFATAAIDAKGKMTFAGALADGTKITASLLPDADAGYRLYLTPYTGRLDSYCAAWFEPQEHPDLPGRGIITLADNLDLYWAKAAPVPTTKDANYRDGIPESACAITLDPWLPPATKPTVITLPTRLVLNSTGDIEPVFESAVSALTPSIPTLLRMDSKGLVSVNLPAVTPANPSGYKVTVTAATGAFVGSFNLMDGSTKRLVNFSGVLRQTPLSETSGAIIGAGFGIVPQLTGQSAGTTSTSISFERPSAIPD